jgi:phenylalanyl-tRNA synthetase beta chain
MKVSTTWIKSMLRRTMLKDSDVVEALDRAGIEIEQVTSSTRIDEKVIVGLVKKVIQHPGADRLKLVEVDTGEGILHIVCGAPNVQSGLKVAVAQIGSVLPGGERIEKAKLRGEISEGMLCSERELNLNIYHNGILELSNDLEVGRSLCDIYMADMIVDIKTPANRWDVQNIFGLAREVAAMTGESVVPLTPPPVDILKSDNAVLSSNIEAERYLLSLIKVSPGEHSPREITAYLQSAGVRSISPVVDVTNFVMLEVGQPLHAFDASKVALPISVRRANHGETLVTLDGTTRTLDSADLVIADATGPIALAGVMGGKATEVTSQTREILLESAVFDGAVIRKMAQRHRLRTEASARFERRLPSMLPALGLARAVELLVAHAGGELIETYTPAYAPNELPIIELRLAKLRQLLGFGISHKEAALALHALGIDTQTPDITSTKDSVITATVPWWRPDLVEPEDLVEEIVRVVGYDKVPSTIPTWRPRHIEFDTARALRRVIRDVMWGAGTFEVMTYSFVGQDQLQKLGLHAKDHLKVKNPLSTEQAYLRTSLLPSHLATLERNRRYAKAMRFYEISGVFMPKTPGEQPDEPEVLAVTVLERNDGYFSIKGILDGLGTALNISFEVRPAPGPNMVYAPGRFGEIWLNDVRVGSIGQLHPTLVSSLKLSGEAAYLEVKLQPILSSSTVKPYVASSNFPTITRDIALVLPETVTWQMVRDVTRDWNVSYVSEYHGSDLAVGTKSITLRLVLSFADRTPTEPEAAELEQSVVARLERKLQAARRI